MIQEEQETYIYNDDSCDVSTLCTLCNKKNLFIINFKSCCGFLKQKRLDQFLLRPHLTDYCYASVIQQHTYMYIRTYTRVSICALY